MLFFLFLIIEGFRSTGKGSDDDGGSNGGGDDNNGCNSDGYSDFDNGS
jgi:hypothetical protein